MIWKSCSSKEEWDFCFFVPSCSPDDKKRGQKGKLITKQT